MSLNIELFETNFPVRSMRQHIFCIRNTICFGHFSKLFVWLNGKCYKQEGNENVAKNYRYFFFSWVIDNFFHIQTCICFRLIGSEAMQCDTSIRASVWKKPIIIHAVIVEAPKCFFFFSRTQHKGWIKFPFHSLQTCKCSSVVGVGEQPCQQQLCGLIFVLEIYRTFWWNKYLSMSEARYFNVLRLTLDCLFILV